MLYLFNYLFFGNTLTSDNTLFGAMSCKLLFIFDRPIICRTVKYIGQSDNSSWLKCGPYYTTYMLLLLSFLTIHSTWIRYQKSYILVSDHLEKCYPVNTNWWLKIEPVHDKCFKYLSSNAICLYCPKFSVSV